MHTISIEGITPPYSCPEHDTVLRSGLRAGLGFPYECNVGSCGNCKFELLEGEIENLWPESPGLSEKDRQRNRWLGCQSRAKTDLRIKLRTSEHYRAIHTPLQTHAVLLRHTALTHDISEFVFECEHPMAFASGQYALIHLPGVKGPRAYSMSNAGVHSKVLEFQVRRVPQGVGSDVLFGLTPGERVLTDGPYGMAYLREDSERDLLLVGGGSGLAPMLSLARGALMSERLRSRQIHFLYGARQPRDLCAKELLEAATQEVHESFEEGRVHYTAVLSDPIEAQALPQGCRAGFVHEALEALHAQALSQFEIYFAGPPLMAQAMIKLLVSHKVPMDQVHFDQFY
jgi:toluene monooxygenase electron transfer component